MKSVNTIVAGRSLRHGIGRGRVFYKSSDTVYDIYHAIEDECDSYTVVTRVREGIWHKTYDLINPITEMVIQKLAIDK